MVILIKKKKNTSLQRIHVWKHLANFNFINIVCQPGLEGYVFSFSSFCGNFTSALNSVRISGFILLDLLDFRSLVFHSRISE